MQPSQTPLLQTLYLLGDINFLGVSALDAARADGLFDHVAAPLQRADMVFANLECCLYDAPPDASERRGFYAPPALGAALVQAGVQVVGNANNVTIGRDAIAATLAELDRLGIGHVGAGADADHARAAQIVERDGVRYGFLQRTAVFWPDKHEAAPGQPGVAVIRAQTAYRPALEQQAARTRPGVPPQVVTWADATSLATWREDVAALRARADVVVASLHWGYQREVLHYQRQFAHAAVDAGADIVFGHGPHVVLPIERYQGKTIFYGVGNFSFQMAHQGERHDDWVGMMVRVAIERAQGRVQVGNITLAFTQRNDANQTLLRPVDELPDERNLLVNTSLSLGARLHARDGVLVLPAAA